VKEWKSGRVKDSKKCEIKVKIKVKIKIKSYYSSK
jgi:hypothetical protein